MRRPAAGNLYEAAEALHQRMVEEGVDLPRPADVPGGLGRFARALWGHLSVEHGLPRPTDDDPALLRFLTAAWTAVEGAELEKAQGPLGRATTIASPVGQAEHTYVEDAVTLQTQINALDTRIDALETVEDWHEIGATDEPAFENSWVNYGGVEATVAFRKVLGLFVVIKGLTKSGVINAAIFTLPAGYRPGARLSALGPNFTNTGSFRCDVLADGQVLYNTGSNGYASLNGIVFMAEQ